MLNATILSLLALELFGIGQMNSDVMFGLKVVLLVMLYGYMHMNLGGGILSTAVFLIFGYYFLFYANGIFALVILGLFFLLMHGFDILWGGDIVKGNVQNIMQQRRAGREAMMQPMYAGPRMPP